MMRRLEGNTEEFKSVADRGRQAQAGAAICQDWRALIRGRGRVMARPSVQTSGNLGNLPGFV